MKIVNANGAAIPALGFGTYRIPGPDVLRIVPHVLSLGYRHIDTAQIYRNETETGEAIASSGVPRGDIFLTTKVWVTNFRHDDFLRSVDESLAKLKTDYVDLLLLHWPKIDEVPMADQIGSLNEVAKAGKVRHIGVSNYNAALLREAHAMSDAPLVTNQVEYHPYLDQTRVIAAARGIGSSVTSYYGMADGTVVKDPLLKEIGARHGKSAAQVALRWLVQQDDVITLSKTVSESRAAENLAIYDFELTAEEMKAIHSLARANGRMNDPHDLRPEWDPMV